MEKSIATARLSLRRFKTTDWQDLHEYLSDEEVVFWEPYGVHSKEDSQAEATKRAHSESFWAVCLKDSGKVIGNLFLQKQDFDTYEIGYVFNKNYQKQGFALESAEAAVQYAFNDLRARRIIAMCSPKNVPSWRLLEKLNMRREGHFLENVYFKTDASDKPIWMDTYAYALLASEI